VAVGNQFNLWAKTRSSGTGGSTCEPVIHDGSSDSAPLSVCAWTTGAAGRDQRADSAADDAILARAALVGQVWAQREIWFRRALCARYDRDDLTQEVFLRVFSRLHTLEKASSIRSFVFSVAVRVVGEEVRRFAWRRRIIEQWPDLSIPSTSPPPDYEMRETLLCVQRCLDGLRDKYRAVFTLRYVDGMELREIGLGLGISRATVNRYLAKALAAIGRFVAKEGAREDRRGLRARFPRGTRLEPTRRRQAELPSREIEPSRYAPIARFLASQPAGG